MAGTYARNIALQKQLKAGGFYRGKIDGIIGPRTLAALQASQQKGAAPPLPRERPDQPGDAGPIAPTLSAGGGDPGAEASGELPLVAQPPPAIPADDFDARRASIRSDIVSPNPNRFGQDLSALSALQPGPAGGLPTNTDMRSLVGLPPAPAPVTPYRTQAMVDAIRRTSSPQAPVNADTLGSAAGMSLPSIYDIQRSLAQAGIMNPPPGMVVNPPNFGAASQAPANPDLAKLLSQAVAARGR